MPNLPMHEFYLHRFLYNVIKYYIPYLNFVIYSPQLISYSEKIYLLRKISYIDKAIAFLSIIKKS